MRKSVSFKRVLSDLINQFEILSFPELFFEKKIYSQKKIDDPKIPLRVRNNNCSFIKKKGFD